MAAKTTVNAKNLESLGAERLSVLLIEISTGNATAKRHLRMALAGAQSPSLLAKEIRKRLVTIERSRSFLDWQGVKLLAADLAAQRSAIVDTIAKNDPNAALEMLWCFMALAKPVFERCDDSNGVLIDIFRQTCASIGDVAAAAAISPATLADEAFAALTENHYGESDGLIPVLAPALGQAGLEHLKQRIIDLSNRPIQRPAEKDRVKIGWSSSGPIYADQIAESSRLSMVKLALQDIADVQGDVDAFIGQYEEQTRKVPAVAARIAHRLLGVGRVEEAWAAIKNTVHQENSIRDWPDFPWEDARIAVLDSLGRPGDAQSARLECFERFLSAPHLRAYLKRVPDFDDIEAEEKALDYARGTTDLHQALLFLVTWPALARAADLVCARAGDLNGDHYQILTPAADALAAQYPLAAILALRAMIDFALTQNRTSRYKHAARHLRGCAGLSAAVEDFNTFETHDAYVASLHHEHGRKTSFWDLLE